MTRSEVLGVAGDHAQHGVGRSGLQRPAQCLRVDQRGEAPVGGSDAESDIQHRLAKILDRFDLDVDLWPISADDEPEPEAPQRGSTSWASSKCIGSV